MGKSNFNRLHSRKVSHISLPFGGKQKHKGNTNSRIDAPKPASDKREYDVNLIKLASYVLGAKHYIVLSELTTTQGRTSLQIAAGLKLPLYGTVLADIECILKQCEEFKFVSVCKTQQINSKEYKLYILNTKKISVSSELAMFLIKYQIC